jgi:DNA-binding transcriptional MerR regulator
MNAQPARSHLGIGEVLARLRPEFPDITVSKIRFLESEGLIEPARSPSRYRQFDDGDVQRLRYILTAQRDQYLPLRVIKEQLARSGQPDAAATAAADRSGGQPAGHSGVLLSRRELLEAAGIDEDQLAELETYGLVRRTGRQYGQEALEVAGTVAALSAYGVQARHLRAVRAAAERETSLIEQVIGPTLRQRNPGARDSASRTARDIAALSLRLHGALVENALAEAGLPAPERPWHRAPGTDAAAAAARPAGAAGSGRPGALPDALADHSTRRGVEGASA